MKAVQKTGWIARLVRAGLLTGVSDAAFSSILVVAFYHSTVGRLWRGVASVVLGPQALEGGTPAALFGVFLHFCTAFGWSAVFLGLVTLSPGLRGVLGRPFGTVKVASLYGPFVWIVMSLLVIPLLAHRPPSITVRWWIQLIGHIPFVAIPIVSSIGRGLAGSEPAK
jgi:hypothetical protein